MRDVYLVSTARTPIGRFGGALKTLSPADLAAAAMQAALERANLSGQALDLYIFGNVLRAGHGQLIPRQGALQAGIPLSVDGMAVDMVCASGMISVYNAANAIRVGDAEIVLAGGTESMSQTGFFLSHRARWGYKLILGTPEHLQDLLMHDGLTDPTNDEAMGAEADRLAADAGVTRAELDEIACESHRRAYAATESGAFAAEITPIEIKSRKGTSTVDRDEGIRADASVDAMAGLRPAFGKAGVVTAGNASQISDGAAALLLASADAVKTHGLTPVAKILGGSWAAGETWRFPAAPVPATQKLLSKLNMSLSDIDLFENNEAFALNNILYHRELGVAYDQMNVNGGAVALGHPIGTSGARILVTLVNALQARQKNTGLAAICHGMGGAAALAVEMV